ncbi:MAG: hypothetical protein PVG49_13410 [Desulfobacteraceae bacterium]
MMRLRTMHSKQGMGQLFRLLVLVSCLIGMQTPVEAADSSFEDIPILTSGSGEIEAELVPVEDGGFICTSAPDLVRMSVDGIEVPCNVQPVSSDRAKVTASFSGLEDGRHKATGTSLGAGGEILATREALFIVDSLPPQLELIQPQTNQLQPTQTSFQVRCRDEGSGISPDPAESGLSMTLNGHAASFQVVEERGELVLIITAQAAQWEPDQTVSLHVEVQDRAGNAASLDRSFGVDTEEDLWDYETIPCVHPDVKFPGFNQTQTLLVVRRIPFPLQTAVHWIRFDAAHRVVTLSLDFRTFQSGSFMDPGIYDALEVKSNHPCVRVKRLSRSPESSNLRFRVSQTGLPQGDNGLGSITVQYPAFVSFDYELFCEEGVAEAELRGMQTEGPLKQYTIPVTLYAPTDYSDEIQVQEDRLQYRFLLAGPGGLDTASSWFDLEGMRAWLTQVGQGVYEASVPVNEGLHVYTTRISLSLCEWGAVPDGEVSDDGRSLLKTDDIFVELDPPQIDHFHYDRENECFRAMVSDQGTALEDLVLELNVSATGGQDPGFDPETGAVLSSYPMPEGIQAALLKVTDRAGQTTTATCRVFGTTPEAQRMDQQTSSYPVTIKEGEQTHSRKPSKSPSNWRISRQYLEAYRNGKQAVTECMKSKRITKENPLSRCIKRAWELYGTTTLSPGESDSSLKATGPSLPAPNPALKRAEKACEDKYPPGVQYQRESEEIEECSTIWVDTLAPRIRNAAFLPASKQVTALIDDHGMPLSQVHMDYRITPAPLSHPYAQEDRPFSFDTGTGLFVGEISLPKETELFKVEIQATDAARNWSKKWLDVTTPLRPPDVYLEILKKGVAAYPLGFCSDHSGIDHRKTRAWLDEKSFPPFSFHFNHPSSPDQVDFAPVTEEGPHRVRLEVTDYAGLTSEDSADFQVAIPPEIKDFRYMPTSLQNVGSPAFSAVIRDNGGDLDLRGIELFLDGNPMDRERFYYDPPSGYFSADGPLALSPGTHLARLTATDAHGHSDEALLRFSPGEPIEVPEGETFDLSIEEVTLWEIENHNGDGRANPGETVRLFVSLTNHGSEGLTGVSGDLESEEPGIAVEKDHLVYGALNPSETVSPLQGFDIRIAEDFLDTRPSDPHEARFTLEATADGGKTWLLDLDLPVYQPTLPFSVVSPEDQDAETNPFASEVTVTLDPLPSNTEQEEIEVTGTAASSDSMIDNVVVRVNGNEVDAHWDPGDGTFSVTVPLELGDNLIEAEAVDRTGAVGMDMGFVFRSDPYVSPQIQITEPTEGDYLSGCWAGYLHGVFDAGSSEVATFQGAMTAEGETVSIPVFEEGEERKAGTFTAPNPLHEYFRSNWGDNHVTTITVTVILTTMDGDTVQDTVTFTYSCYH